MSQNQESRKSSQRRRPRVYLASPLGFTVPTRFYYETELIPRIEAAGYEALDPWHDGDRSTARILDQAAMQENRTEHREILAQLDQRLGERNAGLIKKADVLLAILDGPDVDSGTASEIGFAAAKEKPVIGLRTDLRCTGENEGCTVNLQVEYFIVLSGGTVVQDLDAALSALRDVAARDATDRTIGSHQWTA